MTELNLTAVVGELRNYHDQDVVKNFLLDNQSDPLGKLCIKTRSLLEKECGKHCTTSLFAFLDGFQDGNNDLIYLDIFQTLEALFLPDVQHSYRGLARHLRFSRLSDEALKEVQTYIQLGVKIALAKEAAVVA